MLWEIIAGLSALVLIGVFTGIFKVGSKNQNKAYGVFGILLLVSGVFVLGIFSPSDVGLSSTSSGVTKTTCSEQVPINQLRFATKDALSGSRTALTSGTIEVYEASDDPTNPVVSAIDSATPSSGVALLNDSIKTCTQYRVIYDGGASPTYYSEDFGIVTFDINDYDKENGLLSVDLHDLLAEGGFVNIASITDFVDETTNSTSLNNGNYDTDCRGGSTTAELCGLNTSDTLVYDESVGDGQFYVDLKIEATGSNELVRDEVLCFENSASTPPEGNEISAMTMALRTGTDRNIPSDVLPFWTNEECISLGDATSGTSSDYRLTISVTEANLDTSDDWTLYHDDLGDKNGKDIGLRTGVASDKIDFDAQA